MALFILLTFMTQCLLPSGYAQELMPEPGKMAALSPAFHPPVLTGLKVDIKDPFRFDFILDPGNAGHGVETQNLASLRKDSVHLIKYFLAALTVPEKDLWVNLSPYEKDRIVPEAFGQTEMGRDLVAEDYLLKQITSTLMYPEGETGKLFWQKIYALAAEKFGSIDIPVDTFNKVWIVPAQAVVYENASTHSAYVVKSTLKVMLDSDYVAQNAAVETQNLASLHHDATARQELAKQVIRDVIIPVLEKEVNEGRNFAPLRQVYNALILATWYKKKVKDSLLSRVYVDRKKIAGVNIDDPQEAEKIWGRYVAAFKKGAYNYIREEYDPLTRETIPRKYFAGGFGFKDMGKQLDTVHKLDAAELSGRQQKVSVQIAPTVENPALNDPQTALRQIGARAADTWRIFQHESGPLMNNVLLQSLDVEESLGATTIDGFAQDWDSLWWTALVNGLIKPLGDQLTGESDYVQKGQIFLAFQKDCLLNIDKLVCLLDQDKQRFLTVVKALQVLRTYFDRLFDDNLKLERMNIVTLLAEVPRSFEPSFVDGIGIYSPSGSEEIWIVADPLRLREVFLNLFKNAVEALEPRAREEKITIDARLSPDAKAVVVCISDTGKGMSLKQLQFIWAEGYTSGKKNGHGIGTYVAKKLVEAHGGTIAVESKPDQGTMFTVTLPVSGPATGDSQDPGTGGIDLTSAPGNLEAQGDGAGVAFNFDPAQVARFESASGFVPVIMAVEPDVNLAAFLGLPGS